MDALLKRIRDGRTDLVADYIAAGNSSRSTDADGVSLIQWCADYGDVSAVRLLLANGESLTSLGDNLDLNGAAFHGHGRLCQFLIENGADVNHALSDTGETPLHAALCKPDSPAHTEVVRVLLTAGADPNRTTKPGVQTGCFMRDVRTKGETALHRAAAFGTEEAVQMLLDAGASVEVRDTAGDSPLTWASWHHRSVTILRKLCYGPYRIHPDYTGIDANLLGRSPKK
jgi:ankyrin repeat protein